MLRELIASFITTRPKMARRTNIVVVELPEQVQQAPSFHLFKIHREKCATPYRRRLVFLLNSAHQISIICPNTMYNTSHLLVIKTSHASPREMRRDPGSTTNPTDVKMIVAQSDDSNPVVGLLGDNIRKSTCGKSDVYALTIGFHDV